MSRLTVACPGDPAVANTKMVFLLDDREYDRASFAAHFDDVQAGPGVECVTAGDRVCFRLTDEGHARVDEINARDVHPMFFMSSDTHVKTFMPVARQFRDPQFIVHSVDDQLAIASLESEGALYERHRAHLKWGSADLAVTGCDWGAYDRLFVARARANKVPSVIVQESIIDLDRPIGMMRWADYAIIQGPYSLRYIQRDFAFLAGNPRYDTIKPLPLPDAPQAFINCNFTFNVFEEAGRPWIDDVVSAAEAASLPYMISLHPRCHIDLNGVKNVTPSNAYVVHEQLKASTIVITRFSSLAHEALLMGRHVIYYNPHGETMRYLNEDATGLLVKAYTKEELARAIASCMTSPPPIERDANAGHAFANLFCGTDGKAGERCATAIRAIAATHGQYPSGDYWRKSRASLQAHITYVEKVQPAAERVPFVRAAWRVAKRAFGRE